jgi:hypothetical protein
VQAGKCSARKIEKNVGSLRVDRHHRACPGDPRLAFFRTRQKTWMAGTSSAKTRFALLPGHDECLCRDRRIIIWMIYGNPLSTSSRSTHHAGVSRLQARRALRTYSRDRGSNMRCLELFSTNQPSPAPRNRTIAAGEKISMAAIRSWRPTFPVGRYLEAAQMPQTCDAYTNIGKSRRPTSPVKYSN